MLANTLVQFAEDDWLNDSEAQMQAEDAQWLAARDRHQTEFRNCVCAPLMKSPLAGLWLCSMK